MKQVGKKGDGGWKDHPAVTISKIARPTRAVLDIYNGFPQSSETDLISQLR
jgi:hypothetical protein